MKADRFHILRRCLQEDTELGRLIVDFTFFLKSGHGWMSAAFAPIMDSDVLKKIELINSLLLNMKSFRERKSSNCYFRIDGFDAIILATFGAPPKQSKRVKIEAVIERCINQALNEYRANYNGLTQLINKAAFERRLHDEVFLVQNTNLPSGEGVEATSANQMVSLYTLDVDLFKQCNDTFGHSYGDLVLKCVARRLERAAATITHRNQGRVSAYCAHPSGEEFQVIFTGPISPAEELEIAENLRAAIGDHVLPSEEEWEDPSLGASNLQMLLPHAGDRRVTISVGIANIFGTGAARNAQVALSEIVQKADVALYRAKARGRNRAVHFSKILDQHGMVLEHDRDTGVVAIDIGRSVNVRIGQEFRVFHPKFYGGTPFVFNDGRSQKRLGNYPKVEIGTIEVFDAQVDISFCRMTEKKIDISIPVGSILEAVPAGTITHLVPARGGIPGAQALDSMIESYKKNKQNHTVCIVRLSHSEKLVADLGTAQVNRALAEFYELASKGVRSMGAMAKTDTFEFGIVGPNEQALVSEVTTALTHFQAYDPRIKFVAGVSPTKSFPNHAIDLAKYAAAASEANDQQITVFADRVASNTLYRSRLIRQVEKARADYKKFTEIGISYAPLENQYALCEAIDGDPELALRAIDRAIALDSADGFYALNKAYIMYQANKISECYRLFQDAAAKHGMEKFTIAYLVRFALATYQMYKETQNPAIKSKFEELANLLDKHDMTQSGDFGVKITLARAGIL